MASTGKVNFKFPTYRDLAIASIDTPKVPLWDEPPGIPVM
jgi:hypothetical protein